MQIVFKGKTGFDNPCKMSHEMLNSVYGKKKEKKKYFKMSSVEFFIQHDKCSSGSGQTEQNTVEPRYLELAYFELPLISN